MKHAAKGLRELALIIAQVARGGEDRRLPLPRLTVETTPAGYVVTVTEGLTVYSS